MPEITIDVEALHKKSEIANDMEIGEVVEQLSVSIPFNALGLAAPQIGIYKRIFIANLSSGSYAFINPEITWSSPDKIPSVESCLSLPDIQRCIDRHAQVTVSCAKIIDTKKNEVTAEPDPMRFKGLDALIIQHEQDHLEGKLIIDHPEVPDRDERVMEAQNKKAAKIKANRLKKNSKPIKPQKVKVKKTLKAKLQAKKKKRAARTSRRQEKIRVEIQERYKAEKENLFDDKVDAPIESKPTENQN